jgi:DNA-directed RNA polymerase specialized sigma24 family protein
VRLLLKNLHARRRNQKERIVANDERKPGSDAAPDQLAVEVGRIAKLFALYLLRDVEDESKKITRLNAVGFSSAEIAALLDKTEANVRVQISQAKKKRKK